MSAWRSRSSSLFFLLLFYSSEFIFHVFFSLSGRIELMDRCDHIKKSGKNGSLRVSNWDTIKGHEQKVNWLCLKMILLLTMRFQIAWELNSFFIFFIIRCPMWTMSIVCFVRFFIEWLFYEAKLVSLFFLFNSSFGFVFSCSRTLFSFAHHFLLLLRLRLPFAHQFMRTT